MSRMNGIIVLPNSRSTSTNARPVGFSLPLKVVEHSLMVPTLITIAACGQCLRSAGGT